MNRFQSAAIKECPRADHLTGVRHICSAEVIAGVKGIRADFAQPLCKFNRLQLCAYRKCTFTDSGNRGGNRDTRDICHHEGFVRDLRDVLRNDNSFALFADTKAFQCACALVFQQNAVFRFESHSAPPEI